MNIFSNIYDFISDKNLSIVLFFILGYFFSNLLSSFFINNYFANFFIGLIIGIIFATVARLLYSIMSANLRVLITLVSFIIIIISIPFVTRYIDFSYINKLKDPTVLNPDIIELDLTDINPENIKIDL